MAFVYAWIVPLWADQLLPQLSMEQFDALPLQCRHIEHQHEGVDLEIIISDKMTAVRTQTIFPNKAFVYALMVPSWADQLLSQFLMEQFDMLPLQYRHIEHMHEGVWFRKIIFDKMISMRT